MWFAKDYRVHWILELLVSCFLDLTASLFMYSYIHTSPCLWATIHELLVDLSFKPQFLPLLKQSSKARSQHACQAWCLQPSFLYTYCINKLRKHLMKLHLVSLAFPPACSDIKFIEKAEVLHIIAHFKAELRKKSDFAFFSLCRRSVSEKQLCAFCDSDVYEMLGVGTFYQILAL